MNDLTSKTVKKCAECDEPLSGRMDQKFCSDQCRASYNNRQNIVKNSEIRRINKILEMNYKVLTSLISNGESRLLKSELRKSGFVFNYFTSIYKLNNQLVFFCYDKGLKQLDSNHFLLFNINDNKDLSKLIPHNTE